MIVTIELSPEQEALLKRLAKKSGLAPAEVVHKLVVDNLPGEISDSERSRREKVMRELIAETRRLNLYE